jgi:hypothetical protein
MYFGRGKNRIHVDYTIQDIYKKYTKNIEKGSMYDISFKEFTDICVSFNEKAMNIMFLEAGTIKALSRLGQFQIMKSKQSLDKLSVDFKSTNEAKRTIYHLNEHSNGYRGRFFWSKKNAYLKFKSFYMFLPTRTHKRKLAELIKTNNYDYFITK